MEAAPMVAMAGVTVEVVPEDAAVRATEVAVKEAEVLLRVGGGGDGDGGGGDDGGGDGGCGGDSGGGEGGWRSR